ncbi:MAG: DsbA family protein [Alphaproteobacteria bacterium]|nr:DsbA family protein [Alphaproteobacteria bacterium]
MRMLRIIAATALLGISATPAALAQEAQSKESIEQIVRDYLLTNPEIIVEAMEVLRARESQAEAVQKRAAIEDNYDAIAYSDGDPIAGNPDGDVVIVEFFDYRCPYCKRVVDSLIEAVEDDGNVRLVFKEFPILGPESALAARAALAARMQDKYFDFHVALMKSETRLSEDNVFEIAESVGLDTDQLKEDMKSSDVEATINSTYGLANSLGIGGTPAFVVGREIVPGAIGVDDMKRYIAAARSKS